MKEAKKMKCYRRLLNKQHTCMQVSGLCSTTLLQLFSQKVSFNVIEIFIVMPCQSTNMQRFQPSQFDRQSPDSGILETRKKLLILSIFLRSECEMLRITLSYPIMSHQVSPMNTAVVSKCSKCHLRQIKFAKFPGGHTPDPPQRLTPKALV